MGSCIVIQIVWPLETILSVKALSLPVSRRQSRTPVAVIVTESFCSCRLPSTPSIECHCWLARMASRLPALASAVRWLAQSEEIFFLFRASGQKVGGHISAVKAPSPIRRRQHSRWPRVASSGRVAWRDCKGLTTASEGQRTMVGYIAGVRANLETGPMGRPRGPGGRCRSLAGDHGVQRSRCRAGAARCSAVQ